MRYLKTLLSITLIIALITSLALMGYAVKSNPIPVPTLILTEEHIDIKIKPSSNGEYLIVSVGGTYPFKNLEVKGVTMYFPIPKEAAEEGNISVTIDDKEVSWEIVWEGTYEDSKKFEYYSALGKLPMVKWVLKDLPDEFTIYFNYSYAISAREVNGFKEFMTIYAMATGRLLRTYSKTCTAYVTIKLLNLSGSILNVTLATPRAAAPEGSTSFEHLIKGDVEELKLVEVSSLFKGLSRDLVIKLMMPMESQGYEWVKSRPMSIDIKDLTLVNNTLKLRIEAVLRHAGFKVVWGDYEVRSEESVTFINIPIEVFEWTGPSAQVIITKVKDYTIGPLPVGKYVIQVLVNDEVAKQVKIQVEGCGSESPAHTETTSVTNTTGLTETPTGGPNEGSLLRPSNLIVIALAIATALAVTVGALVLRRGGAT